MGLARICDRTGCQNVILKGVEEVQADIMVAVNGPEGKEWADLCEECRESLLQWLGGAVFPEPAEPPAPAAPTLKLSEEELQKLLNLEPGTYTMAEIGRADLEGTLEVTQTTDSSKSPARPSIQKKRPKKRPKSSKKPKRNKSPKPTSSSSNQGKPWTPDEKIWLKKNRKLPMAEKVKHLKRKTTSIYQMMHNLGIKSK